MNSNAFLLNVSSGFIVGGLQLKNIHVVARERERKRLI